MCPSCQASEETKGLWRQYNSPQCPFCAARLIQQIGKCRSPSSDEITARRRVVLQDAVAYGHSEEVIRKLAKGPLALEGRGK
jgi:hypothetical protein